MIIEKRSMGWYNKPSAWSEAEAQRAKRQQTSQSYLASTSALASQLTGAATAQINGLGDLAARAAASRLNVKI